jgi:Na+-transporting methylmalonyl-CoA/oxaloacetate decarboxylase beta subunit
MDNDKKKIIFPIFLGFIIIFGVIIVPNMLPSVFFSFKEASAVAIIGGADGPTTIYIAASGNWMLILYCSLLLFGIDLIVLGIIKIIEYKINKNIGSKYLFILIFNIIIVLLLFPNTIIQLLILNAIIALIYLIKIFLKKIKKTY